MLTKYPEINKFLKKVKKDLLNIFTNDEVYGMYVTGSLTTNAFKKGLSDIDLIVVTQNRISEKNFNNLKTWSKQILKRDELAKYLDIAFVYKKEISLKTKPSGESVELFKHKVARDDNTLGDNPLIWSQILDSGVRLYGESFSRLISNIPQIEVVKKQLEELESLENNFDDNFKNDLKSRYYTICTMARMLYTTKIGGYISKSKALDWYSEKYSKHDKLVKSAKKYFNGDKSTIKTTRPDEYKKFINEVRTILKKFIN